MLFNISIKQGKNEYQFGLDADINNIKHDLNTIVPFIVRAYKIQDKGLEVLYSENKSNQFSHIFKVKENRNIIISSELEFFDFVLGINNYLIRAAAPNINARDNNVIRVEF